MISLNVKNFFLSIPQVLALVCVRTVLPGNNATPLGVENKINITKLCMGAYIFQHDGTLYRKIKALSMGFPDSVVFPEIIEKTVFGNTTFQILMWKRYLEDCLAILRSSQIEELLTFINCIN